MSLGRLEIRSLCRELLSGNKWWEYLNLNEEDLSIFEIGVNSEKAPLYLSGEYCRYLGFSDEQRSLLEKGQDLSFSRAEPEDLYGIEIGEWTAAYQECIYTGETASHSGPGLMIVKDPNDLWEGDEKYEESKRMSGLYPEHAWIFRNYYEHYDPAEWKRLNNLLVA